jgi:hypothetical protein
MSLCRNKREGVDKVKTSGSQVWRRCGRCGTIFSGAEELRSHLEQHDAAKRRTMRIDEQDRNISGDALPEDRDSIQNGKLNHVRVVT